MSGAILIGVGTSLIGAIATLIEIRAMPIGPGPILIEIGAILIGNS